MAADNQILIQLAISKLSGTKPKGWDTDARELYLAVARTSQGHASSDEIEAAWRDGLAHMREKAKDEWDTYAKSVGKPEDVTAVPWSKVELVKGQSDGDSFILHFLVDGMPCIIECTDIQLLDADFMLRKLVMYTRKDVACPYLGRKQIESWRRNVVLKWLHSDAWKHTERQTMSEQMDDLIREYCANTVAVETGDDVWRQLKRPVLESGHIFVPFSGLQEFVAKHVGNDPSKKVIKNSLARLGFNTKLKGSRRLQYHSITSEKLYAQDIDPGETGIGEINTNREDSSIVPANGRSSVLDELRTEERDGLETESGRGTASPETPSGSPDLPDDPFAVIS